MFFWKIAYIKIVDRTIVSKIIDLKNIFMIIQLIKSTVIDLLICEEKYFKSK